MNRNTASAALLALSLALANVCVGQDKIELETTTIKGNKELPKILYVVPWQDSSKDAKDKKQQLVLHSLFGDLFDPVIPEGIPATQADSQ